jgi:branched-chain amino acid transport system ATP-binding protein
MLSVTNLVANYGLVQALRGVSLEVRKGEIVTLIGANGAGKTTLLKSIMNVVAPAAGDVRLFDSSLFRHRTEAIVRKGIVLVQEGRGMLRRMTVLENLLMGGYIRRNKEEMDRTLETVYGIFPVLRNRQTQSAGTLSGGEQQMLAIGRALMADPAVLMLDEPSLGLAPIIVNDIFSIIKDLHSAGRTVLLVEQNARKALQIADRGYVIELGRITLEGASIELLQSDDVRKAYLGRK